MRPPSRYVGRVAHYWHSIDRQLKGPTLSLGLIERLKALKLHGMAQALTDLVQQDSPAYQSCSPILSQLLRAELTEREVRSIAYQMKVAKFPAYREPAPDLK